MKKLTIQNWLIATSLHLSKWILLIAVVLAPSMAVGQDKDATDDEAGIHIRVSKTFLESISKTKFDFDIPIDRTENGMKITGSATGEGISNYLLMPSPTQARFTLQISGSVQAKFKANIRKSAVLLSTTATFDTSIPIVFNGEQFKTGKGKTNSKNLTSIDATQSRGKGPVGRLVRRILCKTAQAQKQEIDKMVEEATEETLTASFDEQATKLVNYLNEFIVFDESVDILFPDAGTWVYHLATYKEYLHAGAGPKKGKIPPQIKAGGKTMESDIEVWVKTTKLQHKLMEKILLDWDVAHDALREFLPDDVARTVADNVNIVRRENWSLIQIGQLFKKPDGEKSKTKDSQSK